MRPATAERLENNAENTIKNGGQGGIRTLDRLTPILVFETSMANYPIEIVTLISVMFRVCKKMCKFASGFLSKSDMAKFRYWPPEGIRANKVKIQ